MLGNESALRSNVPPSILAQVVNAGTRGKPPQIHTFLDIDINVSVTRKQGPFGGPPRPLKGMLLRQNAPRSDGTESAPPSEKGEGPGGHFRRTEDFTRKDEQV